MPANCIQMDNNDKGYIADTAETRGAAQGLLTHILPRAETQLVMNEDRNSWCLQSADTKGGYTCACVWVSVHMRQGWLS